MRRFLLLTLLFVGSIEAQVTFWQSAVIWRKISANDPQLVQMGCTPAALASSGYVCFYTSLDDGLWHEISSAGDVVYGVGPQGPQGVPGPQGPAGPGATWIAVSFTLVASPTGGFTATIPLPSPGYHFVQCFNQNGQANVQTVQQLPVGFPTRLVVSYNASISGVCLIL